ncbi:hypothetical protein [Salinicola acroporae]|uniref:hypothetical protein n=1 Tax=Salinicola acroporae TaxID=1541440 RepID=UPI0013A64F01|nr:hypothetical protein [Salinicola acroporae]
MNIPSIPTDNLYKFFAITGIFIFFGTLGASAYLNFTITKELDIQDMNQAILGKRIDYNTSDVERLNKMRDAAEKSNQVSKAKIDNLVKRVKKVNQENAIANIKNKYHTKRIKALIRYEDKVKLVKWALLAIGLFFILAGFLLWYFMLQNPIDKKLKAEASKE